MKSLTVKVDENLYRRLDRYVKRYGHTKNGLIVALLKAHLEGGRGLSGVPLHADHPFWDLAGRARDGGGVSENVDAILYGPRRKA